MVEKAGNEILCRLHADAEMWRTCPDRRCRRQRVCRGDLPLCVASAFPAGYIWIGELHKALRQGRSPRAALRAAVGVMTIGQIRAATGRRRRSRSWST